MIGPEEARAARERTQREMHDAGNLIAAQRGWEPMFPQEPEPEPAPVLPAVAEQWPAEPQYVTPTPEGGWATDEGVLLALGWKPSLVEYELGIYLRRRENLLRVFRDLRSVAANNPDLIPRGINSENYEQLRTAFTANGLAKEFAAQGGRDSPLFTWNLPLERGRLVGYWRHPVAVMKSLEHFEGRSADAVRALVVALQSATTPPEPLPSDVMLNWQ